MAAVRNLKIAFDFRKLGTVFPTRPLKKCDATDTPTPVNCDATDTHSGQESVTIATPGLKSYPQASILAVLTPLLVWPASLTLFIAR